MKDHPLIDLRHRHLASGGGTVAVCSAHPMVLRTAMREVRARDGVLLVEATANQVNQAGGYTGMTPADFAAFIAQMAAAADLPAERIVLGADHLGPHVWRHLTSEPAMTAAMVLTRECVAAGFRKIHLDTAAGCADDHVADLPVETAAQRAVRLCRVAEQTAAQQDVPPPCYVIGTEVPVPGGGLEASQPQVRVTRADDLFSMLDTFAAAFRRAGLSAAWERVLAVVVQPGVDFGDRRIASYRPEAARALAAAHDRLPGAMTFEVHAGDYQTGAALTQMIEDHFAIVKIGPCLTFALREVLYALSQIEASWPGLRFCSQLPQVMETLMLERPQYWQNHYRGTYEEQRFLRHFSFRDRIRYYWSDPAAMQAVNRLMQNLHRPFPAALVRQFLPDLFPDMPPGTVDSDPRDLILRRLRGVLAPYLDAYAGAP